jgi:hypothetical protein
MWSFPANTLTACCRDANDILGISPSEILFFRDFCWGLIPRDYSRESHFWGLLLVTVLPEGCE